MKGKKSTRSAFLTSLMSLVLCFAMLLGTTFAWFTDTASTAVNKIQAGNLDVALEMKKADGTWENAEGETLQFKVNGAIPAEGTQILWEPGCTYELPAIRVVNKGNLALKYKIVLAGISGSAKLNEVIEWTMTGEDGHDYQLDGSEEFALAPAAESTAITIKGHMQESADNTYQGLTIDGIAIMVSATQATAEFDSFNDQYDAAAPIPASTAATGNLNVTTSESGTDVTVASEQKISDSVMSVTYPAGVKLTTTAGDVTDSKATVVQKLDYTGSVASNGSISVGDGQTVEQYELTLPVASDNNVLVPVEIKRAAGLGNSIAVYHNGSLLSTTVSDTSEYFAYNNATGVLTLYLLHASPIDIVYDAPVAIVNGVSYYTIQDAINAVPADGTLVLLKDTTGDRVSITKNITIDGAGHTLTDNKSGGRAIWIEATGVTLNLKNLTIDGAGKCERGVQVNVLDGDAWNYATINMDGCTVKNMTYYAINLCSKTTVNLTITNCTISGWAAINAYGTGNTITVKNSVLEGINDKGYSEWNNFCTVCLEGDTTGHSTLGSADYNVVIEKSTIIAKQTTGNYQAAVGFNTNSKHSTVTLTNTEIVLGDTEKCYKFYDNGTDNTIFVDGVEVVV